MDDHGHDKRRELEGIQELAARETILIKRWKRLLTVLLLFGAILVATGAFFMLSREEEANYKDAVSRNGNAEALSQNFNCAYRAGFPVQPLCSDDRECHRPAFAKH
jgi:hypothetical protein